MLLRCVAGPESAAAAAAGNKGASKKLHVAATLEKNIASITVKKFDMEFDVDPLFHKVRGRPSTGSQWVQPPLTQPRVHLSPRG